MHRFNFPSRANRIGPVGGTLLLLGSVYVVAVAAYGTSPDTTNVGYSPKQPVPFSHKLHAGTLKMDCRYCHTGELDTTSAGGVS